MWRRSLQTRSSWWVGGGDGQPGEASGWRPGMPGPSSRTQHQLTVCRHTPTRLFSRLIHLLMNLGLLNLISLAPLLPPLQTGESLVELVKAVMWSGGNVAAAARSGEHTAPSELCLELLVALALRNRDRVGLIWPLLHEFLAACTAAENGVWVWRGVGGWVWRGGGGGQGRGCSSGPFLHKFLAACPAAENGGRGERGGAGGLGGLANG